MLAPVGELTFGERELLELALRSAALWPEFAAEVEAAGGVETGYERCGALHVALDRDEAARAAPPPRPAAGARARGRVADRRAAAASSSRA